MDLRPGSAELPRAGALPPAPGGVDSKGSGDLLGSFHAVLLNLQDGFRASKGPEHYDLGDKKRLADFLIDADIRLVTPAGWGCSCGFCFGL